MPGHHHRHRNCHYCQRHRQPFYFLTHYSTIFLLFVVGQLVSPHCTRRLGFNLDFFLSFVTLPQTFADDTPASILNASVRRLEVSSSACGLRSGHSSPATRIRLYSTTERSIFQSRKSRHHDQCILHSKLAARFLPQSCRLPLESDASAQDCLWTDSFILLSRQTSPAIFQFAWKGIDRYSCSHRSIQPTNVSCILCRVSSCAHPSLPAMAAAPTFLAPQPQNFARPPSTSLASLDPKSPLTAAYQKEMSVRNWSLSWSDCRRGANRIWSRKSAVISTGYNIPQGSSMWETAAEWLPDKAPPSQIQHM